MDGEIDGKKTAEMTFLRYISKSVYGLESKKTQTFGVSFLQLEIICFSIDGSDLHPYTFLFINFNFIEF